MRLPAVLHGKNLPATLADVGRTCLYRIAGARGTIRLATCILHAGGFFQNKRRRSMLARRENLFFKNFH
jgi:hypothetical protein